MNFEDLGEAEHDRIVGAGLDLIAAITDAFGPEEGQKIWDDLSEQFGKEIRDAIFMSMLTGRASGSVMLHGQTGVRQNGHFIDMIKIVRNYTGFGLKEAKDLCDLVDSGTNKTIKIDYKRRAECVRALRELGGIEHDDH